MSSDVTSHGIAQNPSGAMVSALGSLFYYAGWTAVSEGMIAGLYGVAGTLYHGQKAVRAAFVALSNGSGFSGLSDNAEIKKAGKDAYSSLSLAVPSIAFAVGGLALRSLGEKIQDPKGWLYTWVESHTKH